MVLDLALDRSLCATIITQIRDGLERIEVADSATLGDLRAKIHQQLDIPIEQITLSQDAKLVRGGGCIGVSCMCTHNHTHSQLTTKDPSSFTDLAHDSMTITKAGLTHGSMVCVLMYCCCVYPFDHPHRCFYYVPTQRL